MGELGGFGGERRGGGVENAGAAKDVEEAESGSVHVTEKSDTC